MLISKNYRPVSNLCFLSKLVERCILHKLLTNCNENNLLPDFQSTYHQNYNTETSLIKLFNDILWVMEKQNITMVIILDLSVAFATVDYKVLLEIMEQHFRLTDTALKWVDEYLRSRCFKVCKGNSYCTPKELNFRVPHGSCSGANIFICYSASIEKAIPSHITINGFADDHSIRKTYKGLDRQQEISTKQELEHTFNNIKTCMD